MTGYGKSEKQTEKGIVTVEIRAVNNRFFDLSLRLPDFLEPYSEELKRIANNKLLRGKINVSISLNGESEDFEQLKLNIPLLKKYHKTLCEIIDTLSLDEKVKLQHLLTFSDLLELESDTTEGKEIINFVKEAFNEAIDNLVEMRIREGEYLSKEISNRLRIIEKSVSEIENISMERKNKYFNKFKTQLENFCKDLDFDNDRILQEAAIFTSKIDITEECERLHSHINQFNNFLNSNEIIGKKLTFLVQEAHREINTIGAKSEDTDISHYVIEIKNELEKIREQAQNIL